MDNNPLNGAVVGEDYHQITGCESDDSRSSISRSDDNEALPSIIYTSDDSADVSQSPHSNYVDPPGAISYIAQHVCQLVVFIITIFNLYNSSICLIQ